MQHVTQLSDPSDSAARLDARKCDRLMPDVDRTEFRIVRILLLIRREGPEEKMISRGMKYEGTGRNAGEREDLTQEQGKRLTAGCQAREMRS